MTRRTATLTIVTYRVVEEIDDDKPSLPPIPIDVDGETISENTQPLRKCGGNVIALPSRKAI